jgi:hypothetical protein
MGDYDIRINFGVTKRQKAVSLRIRNPIKLGFTLFRYGIWDDTSITLLISM